MRSVEPLPRLHLFVCCNRRAPGDPLGDGCADRGEAVYAALKAAVARAGTTRSVWVTRTFCLGTCPRRGCTVARYPDKTVVAEVEPGDAAALLSSPDPVAARGGPA